MKKIKNLKSRLVSLSLAFVMVLSLTVGMGPMNVYAEDESSSTPLNSSPTLTYEVVGGTGTMKPVSLTIGETFTLPNPSFTANSGREFLGWFVYDGNNHMIDCGYQSLNFPVEDGKTYKAIAYYGYEITVEGVPLDVEVTYMGSATVGNATPIVVPEFADIMMEGNVVMISKGSLTAAPSFSAVNAKTQLVGGSDDDGYYLYLVSDIKGPVTLTLVPAPEVSGNIEHKENVSIKKLEANKYEVTGLTEEVGFTWVYNLVKVDEGQDVNSVVETALTGWLSAPKDKYVELKKVWGIDEELYFISGDFYRTQIDDFGYVQIFKLDTAENVHEIAVLPLPKSTIIPDQTEDTIIDAINVEFDWNKIPLLEVGMGREDLGCKAIPSIPRDVASITGTGVEEYISYNWVVKVNESFKITSEDDIYNEVMSQLGDQDGAVAINDFNSYIDKCIATNGGWSGIDRILGIKYTLNSTDTYGVATGITAADGYTFSRETIDVFIPYQGTINSNVPVDTKLVYVGGTQAVMIYKLGTLDEIEDEKNEANGGGTNNPTPAPDNGNNGGNNNFSSSSSSTTNSTTTTTTPSSTPITVPVSNGANDNVVHINASVSGEKATVSELTADEINKVAKNETKKSIEINLSETGNKVKEVALPVSSLNEIARIMDDPSNKLDNVTIKLSTATVEVSEHTLKAVLSKTTGNDLRLVVDDIHKDTLNDTQKEAVKNQNVHQCVDAYFISNGVRIGDFQGGTATIRLPFNVPAGLNGNGFSVWYVGDDGTIEKHDTKYVNGELVFAVSHFSDYVVVYDDAVKDNVPKTGGSADYTTILWTAILAIGVFGLVLNRQKRRQ